VFFSSFLLSKFPSPQRDQALRKKRARKNIEEKKEEGKKAPIVSANKKGKSIF
jgi:hypothetical protein